MIDDLFMTRDGLSNPSATLLPYPSPVEKGSLPTLSIEGGSTDNDSCVPVSELSDSLR
jgi:hypothetical protein